MIVNCGVAAEDLITTRGIEVWSYLLFRAEIFSPMGASVADETGSLVDVHMGSYGIGVSRLVGGIIEAATMTTGSSGLNLWRSLMRW